MPLSSEDLRLLERVAANDPSVKEVNLSGRGVGYDGAKKVAEAFRFNTTVTFLNLWDNDIGDEGAKALAEVLRHNSAVTGLWLNNNRIGDEGAKALAEMLLHNSAITALSLHNNRIAAKGAKALAEMLRHNSAITKLSLGINGIGDEGAKALAKALLHNSAITYLGLKDNGIGAEGAEALADVLLCNSAITKLSLDLNDIGPALDSKVGQLVEINEESSSPEEAQRRKVAKFGGPPPTPTDNQTTAAVAAVAAAARSEETARADPKGAAAEAGQSGPARNEPADAMSTSTAAPSSSSFPAGSRVTLRNLSKAEYNGLEGTVRLSLNSSNGRQEVYVASLSKSVALRPANLRYVPREVDDLTVKEMKTVLRSRGVGEGDWTGMDKGQLAGLVRDTLGGGGGEGVGEKAGEEVARILAEANAPKASVSSASDGGAAAVAAANGGGSLTPNLAHASPPAPAPARALSRAVALSCGDVALLNREQSTTAENSALSAHAEPMAMTKDSGLLVPAQTKAANERAGQEQRDQEPVEKLRGENTKQAAEVSLSDVAAAGQPPRAVSPRGQSPVADEQEAITIQGRREGRLAESMDHTAAVSLDPNISDYDNVIKTDDCRAESATEALLSSSAATDSYQPTKSASTEARSSLRSVLVSINGGGLPCTKEESGNFGVDNENPDITHGRFIMQQVFGIAQDSSGNSAGVEDDGIPEVPLKYLEYCTNNWEKAMGEGGNGTVFWGIDDKANLSFAVKRHHKVGGGDKEINILSKFRHPFFIRLLAKTTAAHSKSCLVLEYMPRGSLDTVIKDSSAKGSYLTLPRRISIASHVTAALCYLHHFQEGNEKLYHRDVKSANICLDDDYTAKLIDCGISKIAQKDATHVTNTCTGTTGFGTWGYKAPEFAMDATYYTEKCEVFSLGIVLLELVVGEVTKGASIYQKYGTRKCPLDYDKSLLTQHGGTVPEALEQFGSLALKCTSYDADDRPTLKEVLKEVNELLDCSFGGADTSVENDDETKCTICHDLVGTNSSCGRHYLCNTHFCNHVLRHLEMKTIPCVEDDCAVCFTDAQIASFSIDLLVQHVAARTRAEEREKESSLLPILKQIDSNVSDVKNITMETHQKLVLLSTKMLEGLLSLASGRVLCPPLFVVIPENTKPNGLGSPKKWMKRFTHNKWLLYFLCAHDKKPVFPPITINEPKVWLRKVAPYLKLMFLAMQVAVKAATSITFDLNVVPIPGEEETKLEGLIDFTNSLLGPEICKKIDDCTASLENDVKLADAVQEFGPEMQQAYDYIAEESKKSSGWRRDMVQVNSAEGIVWVRKRYGYLYSA